MKKLIPLNSLKFKEKYPGWCALVQKANEKRFTVKDVIKYTGLTKRKVLYIIEKGILVKEGQEGQKWNRFSLLDLFFLSIINELRCRGIELDFLPIELGKAFMKHSEITELFVRLIYGDFPFLITDLKNIIEIRYDDKDDLESNANSIPDIPLPKERSFVNLGVALLGRSTFFIGLQLKQISDELINKLDVKDFKAEIQSDGAYKFFINGVPLQLESL